MKPKYLSLSEQKICTQWFVVPSIGIVLAFGINFYNDFLKKQKTAELIGHELLLIGWPNGTNVLWENSDPTLKINLKELVEAYHAFHIGIDLYYAKAGSC